MQKLIITADDYGMCDAVDKAIDEGIENGFITTTNVMVNMESLNNAKDLRTRYPNISIGIHWNVTTGKPISSPKEIPTLVDKNGQFWHVKEFKRRYEKGLITSHDLEKELESQYIVFKKICGKADYWNTHENSSLSIKTYKAFEKIAKKYGIKATRTFQRVYYDKKGLSIKSEIRELLVRIFFQIWFERIRKSFTMPAARVVSFDKLSKTEGDILLNALKKDGRDYIEVVFHPALIADSPYFGNISNERVKEYKYITSGETYKKYIDNGIVFVNYQALESVNNSEE